MTLSGAWDKLRTDPGLRFSVTAVGFYGMATFEGPVMSIKAVNSLSHYTDWTIGHVHSGALGWVAFIVFGTMYYLGAAPVGPHDDVVDAPDRLALLDRDDRHRPLHHVDVGERHHAGPDVARLRRARLPAYSFVESVAAMHPFYAIRLLGGVFFLSGGLIMAFNMWRTVRAQPAALGADGHPVFAA